MNIYRKIKTKEECCECGGVGSVTVTHAIKPRYEEDCTWCYGKGYTTREKE